MAGTNPYPDSSVVFAFLLILLGSFGVFIVGGVAWHWARARRRALVAAALARRALRSTWAGGAPRLWDIWPGPAPGAPDGLAGSKARSSLELALYSLIPNAVLVVRCSR